MSITEVKSCIVSTIKGAENYIDTFVKYHLNIGFNGLILFLDDPSESYPIEKNPNVIVIRNDQNLHSLWKQLDYYNKYADLTDKEVMARQILNLGVAVSIIKATLDIDWIVHLDYDELFFIGENSNVNDHFTELSRKKIVSYNYLNYEAVSTSLDVDDIFRETRYFKKNLFKSGFSKRQKRWLSNKPDRIRKFVDFKAYANGKSATLVNRIIETGIHECNVGAYEVKILGWRIVLRKAIEGLFFSISINRDSKLRNEPIILHYTNCSFEQFWNKYALVFGDFPDYWFEKYKISAIAPIHSKSRDIVKNQTKEEALQYYEYEFLVNKDELQELIENQFIIEIDLSSKLTSN